MTADDHGALLPTASGRVVLGGVWGMLSGRRLALAGVLLIFLAEGATALVFPFVIGDLVDAVIAARESGARASLVGPVALLVGASVLAGVLSWAGAISMARLAETVVAGLREDYVASALALPRHRVEAAGTGDIVTRAGDDIAQISGSLPDVLAKLCVSAFTIVLVAGGLAGVDWRYLVGFAVTLPMYLLTIRWYLRTAPEVYAATRAAESRRGQEILGTLTQLPAVIAHRLGPRRLDGTSTATWQTARWAMRTRIVQNRLFGRLNLTEALGLAAVLGIGVHLAHTGEATAGAVTAAALLFLRTVAPMAALLMVMDDVQSAYAAMARLFGVTTMAKGTAPVGPAPVPANSRSASTSLRVLVDVDRVDFAYREGVPVLEAVSLGIRAGESVAVVGATGSGKSTLAALVAGVHSPDAGRVIRRVTTDSIVTVTQETHVFDGTLRANLTLACPTATDDEVLAAIDKVGAREVIDGFPDGLDTRLGAGEHPVTPAQAQHLALVRVLLCDPAVVVLDEATAEADTADTDTLDRAATVVLDDRAALVIAHRLTQAAASDRIVVLDGGRVVEVGPHDELVADGGVYAELWHARAGVASG